MMRLLRIWRLDFFCLCDCSALEYLNIQLEKKKITLYIYLLSIRHSNSNIARLCNVPHPRQRRVLQLEVKSANIFPDNHQKKKGGGQTFGSVIFKYRTWIPLVVKYGISNFTLIGLFAFPNDPAPPILPPNPPVIPPPCSSSPLTDGRPSSARIRNSLPPPNCLIFQMMADCSGA